MKRTLSRFLTALAVVGLAGTASAQVTSVAADVVADETWCDDETDMVLERPIFVTGGATLTILPGCIVRSQPRTGPVVVGAVAGTPGALIVTRDGRINAVGQPTNPIVFTTAATDNDNDGVADDADADTFDDPWAPGDAFLDEDPQNAPLAPLDTAGNENVSKWGGVVILGSAPTNLANDCGLGWGECTIEGLTIPGFPVSDATYGGSDVHDSSGLLEYASIRHAGDEIGDANELNCLSMGGVGDATVLSNVECYANFDDGFEWFGGTVDGTNLVSIFVGDDSFDLDQGYTGVNQFLFAIQTFFNEGNGDAFGSASGDKAGEWDGDDSPDVSVRIQAGTIEQDPDLQCCPFPNPSVWNMTVIGTTAPAGSCAPQTAADNRGIQMRNGYAGKIFNSVIVNTGARTGIEIDATDRADATSCSDTIDHVGTCDVAVASTTIADSAALGANELAVLACGDAIAVERGGSANVVNPFGFGLVQEDATFDPTGDADGKLTAALQAACAGPIDPRTSGFGPAVAPGVPATGRKVEPVTFRGAFAPGQALWTTGWSLLNQAGMLVSN